jgi:flagellar basal-body rod modification protein FlgD
MADAVSGTGTTGTYDPTSTTAREIKQNLDKDDFLQLMITQMQYQDPLNPMDNTEQLAQQAQFSSLEQMQNMNDNLGKLLDAFNTNQKAGTLSMIGKNVSGYLVVPEENEEGEVEDVTVGFEGVVKAVDFSSGESQLLVEVGDKTISVPAIQITSVYTGDSPWNGDVYSQDGEEETEE